MDVVRVLGSVLIAASLTPEAFCQSPSLPATIDCVEVVHAQASDALDDYAAKRGSMKLTFSEQISGQYAMIGNTGLAELVTVRGEGFIQLVERTPAGSMNLTTILTMPDRGNYAAVHSRHSIILGTLVPSQYLLSCRGR